MLFEFAMTLDLFDASIADTDSRADVILIELLRGIAENGLLANLHKDRWLGHICEERITSLPPAMRDRVLACLKVLHDRHRLVRHPKGLAGDPETDLAWLKLALDSHRRIPFHAILLSQVLMKSCDQKCDDLVEFFGSLDSAQWEERRRRTLTLRKSEGDYRLALAPILRYAKSLILVDSFLNTNELRYFNTIAICSNLMGQREQDSLKGRIDIHAEAKKQKPEGRTAAEYLRVWEQKLRSLSATDGHRFRVFLWESLQGSPSMHDRFILTDQCGISIPSGLDCRSHSQANSTDWSLLDEDTRQQRWNDYDLSASPFRLVGKKEINP